METEKTRARRPGPPPTPAATIELAIRLLKAGGSVADVIRIAQIGQTKAYELKRLVDAGRASGQDQPADAHREG